MSRLLRAGFFRVFRTRVFYICLAVMAAGGVNSVLAVFSDRARGYIVGFDALFFECVPLVPILLSVFCSLFIGTEYSDGTMRNKIISGHERAAVYFSEFIVCAVSGLMMCGAYFAAYFGLGLPLLGAPESAGGTAALVGCSGALLLALTGIFTLIAVLVKSKSAASVISIILAFVMLLAAGILYSLLQQPEYYHEYELYGYSAESFEAGAHFYSEGGDYPEGDGSELVPNANYVSGLRRQIYQFILEFTPGGQALLISLSDVGSPPLLAGYSLLIAAATVIAGLAAFNRMNLN